MDGDEMVAPASLVASPVPRRITRDMDLVPALSFASLQSGLSMDEGTQSSVFLFTTNSVDTGMSGRASVATIDQDYNEEQDQVQEEEEEEEEEEVRTTMEGLVQALTTRQEQMDESVVDKSNELRVASEAPATDDTEVEGADPEQSVTETGTERTVPGERELVSLVTIGELDKREEDVAAGAIEGTSTPLKPSYSVEALFPIVYEPAAAISTRRVSIRPLPAPANHNTDQIQQLPASQPPTNTTTKPRKSTQPTSKRIAGPVDQRVQMLQKQVHSLQTSLHHHQMQFEFSENDRKKLAQRNARLKTQLRTLTTELTRSKAETTKLQTENELYAAKLPQLQQELLQETQQVDEKHAQSIQIQLEVTQLRAKAHVLQTRTANLEKQLEKMTEDTRASKKELRKKLTQFQQQEDKLKRVESELHELKTTRAQEMAQWKSRLASAIQRSDNERVKLESEMQRRHKEQLSESTLNLKKAQKARREAEMKTATLEQQVRQLQKTVQEQSEELRHGQKEARALQVLLRKAEETEATLRARVSGFQYERRAMEKRVRTHSEARYVNKRFEKMVRGLKEVVSECEDDSEDGFDLERPELGPQDAPIAGALCSCCAALLDANPEKETETDQVQADTDPVPCESCSRLLAELEQTREELMRTRELHSSELKVQANAYERVLASIRPISTRSTASGCA